MAGTSKCIFPGSFDPFTTGHEDVVRRAMTLFKEVIVAVGVNSAKNNLFTVEQRLAMISGIFSGDKGAVNVVSYQGLTVDFCLKNGIEVIIRGLRNSRDFEFEYEIANMNRALSAGIQTIFLASDPATSAVNSTIVREIYRNGGDVSAFIPAGCKLP